MELLLRHLGYLCWEVITLISTAALVLYWAKKDNDINIILEAVKPEKEEKCGSIRYITV